MGREPGRLLGSEVRLAGVSAGSWGPASAQQGPTAVQGDTSARGQARGGGAGRGSWWGDCLWASPVTSLSLFPHL